MPKENREAGSGKLLSIEGDKAKSYVDPNQSKIGKGLQDLIKAKAARPTPTPRVTPTPTPKISTPMDESITAK